MSEAENVNLDQHAASIKNRSINRKIWSLAGPMMLSNISLPLLGLVDTAVMGHLDSAVYLAAVSVGAMIIHFIFWGFGFLRMATVGLTAQGLGSGDFLQLKSVLLRAAIVAMIIASLILLLHPWLLDASLYLVKPDPDITVFIESYFNLRIWSAPATLLTYVAVGWFMGMQQARTVLLIMVAVNLLNIVLDILFVPVLGMGIEGVAVASVLSEYAGLLLAIVLLLVHLKKIPSRINWHDVFNLQAMTGLLQLNGNIFVRTIALLFAFAFFTTQSARAGELVMAANAVLLQFITFMAYVLDAYAHAAEAMVGEVLGQIKTRTKEKSSDDAAGLDKVVKACSKWSFISAAGFALFYLVAGDYVVALLTDIESVRQYAGAYLPWLAFMPLIAVWSYLFDGVFIGATWSREMRNVMLAAVLMVYLPAWYLTAGWSNHGLWFSLMMFLLARGMFMVAFYFRKRAML